MTQQAHGHSADVAIIGAGRGGTAPQLAPRETDANGEVVHLAMTGIGGNGGHEWR
mgnify:CR=1 FL=1